VKLWWSNFNSDWIKAWSEFGEAASKDKDRSFLEVEFFSRIAGRW
jgi:hypothetical protein